MKIKRTSIIIGFICFVSVSQAFAMTGVGESHKNDIFSKKNVISVMQRVCDWHICKHDKENTAEEKAE